MNSKQLFLTTALLTSLSSTAMADVSISGEAKVNVKGGHYVVETDLTVSGKSGDTSVVAQLDLDNMLSGWGDVVEQLYMTSKVAGINIKTGTFKTNKDELKHTVTKSNTTQLSIPFGTKPIDSYTDDIDSLSCHNGNSCFELVWQDFSGPGGEYAMIKGSLVGVKFLHKDTSWGKKETKVLSNISGIDLAYHVKNFGPGNVDRSYTIKTSTQDIDWTYVNTKSDTGTKMDGFIGKDVSGSIQKASAFGISTTIAGNKVTYKEIRIQDSDHRKLIISRKMASNTTFEATYINNSESLDLELAVKF